MAPFQPIEDAGPRLLSGLFVCFGFCYCCFTWCCRGKILQKTKTVPDYSKLFKRTPGQDGTMVFRDRFGRKNRFQEIFLIGRT